MKGGNVVTTVRPAWNGKRGGIIIGNGAGEKIQRCEMKLERQLFRAMAQLERVQRMRKGEKIPAPISVNVSDRG